MIRSLNRGNSEMAATDDPKTIRETQLRMQQVVREFRAQAVGAGIAERDRLASRARCAIERLHKQFKHKIHDRCRRDAKRHSGINDGERIGLENQVRQAAEEAMDRLEQAAKKIACETN